MKWPAPSAIQKLDTRSARAKLAIRNSIYWVSLAPGCALGYRKGPKGGVWIAKLAKAGLRTHKTLGPADDALDPDGVLAISYADAQTRAREWFAARHQAGTARHWPLQGPRCGRRLSRLVQRHRQEVASRRLRRASTPSSCPGLATWTSLSLTPARLRKWHMDIAAAPPRLRTRPGEKQKVRDTADDPEAQRRRRATANRILTVLKAALNHAWREGKVPSDDAWRRVAPFREADAARVHYLNRDECRRLVNAQPRSLAHDRARRAVERRPLQRTCPHACRRFPPRQRHSACPDIESRESSPHRADRRRTGFLQRDYRGPPGQPNCCSTATAPLGVSRINNARLSKPAAPHRSPQPHRSTRCAIPMRR